MRRSFSAQFRLMVVLIGLALGSPVIAASPFSDAQAVWHLGDANENRGHFGPLSIQGDVTLGVALTAAEREASLRRGGDGRVARFNGGYLRAAAPADRPFTCQGKDMTLAIRLQDPAGQWASPLFAKDAAGRYSTILGGADGLLCYLWQTELPERRIRPPHPWLATTGPHNQDFVDGVLRLRVPVSLIGPTGWHDIVARFRGPNLELFVDGVLVDEEWPHGALHDFTAPFLIGAGYRMGQLQAKFHGLVDHVAIWNRALKDEEIVELSGGAEEVGRRDREILGPVQESPQYWKPRGYNAWAGDCMPLFHDGTFHLFYLFDRRHHQSKWAQGAHQYAQISTTDLVHWKQQPMAVPIIQQWECAMGTGDCIWHDGHYRFFYTDCGSRAEYLDKPQQGSWIFVATSTDGIHFQKDLKPVVPGGDCTIFRDPATGLFHLIRGGGNRLVSKDLRHWEEVAGDFVRRLPETSGECPHLFSWNGWFYFVLGTNGIWKSRSALGPWEPMKPTIYDGLYVPKVAEFTGNRRLLAGWIGTNGWGGHLALRELIQSANGSLGMKFPPELIPSSGEPQQLKFAAIHPQASGDGDHVAIQAGKPFATAALDGVARNVRITLRVVPQPGARSFGLCLRGKGDYEDGCELRFDPGRQRAQYGVPRNHGPANDATGSVVAGRDYAIADVEGLDRPFTLDIIVKDDLVDTCIDGRRTMITRRDPEPGGDRLFFFAREGQVTFESIKVRPLEQPQTR
jgi:beta-fructofuranosidase